jgi:hypothetical protein
LDIRKSKISNDKIENIAGSVCWTVLEKAVTANANNTSLTRTWQW